MKRVETLTPEQLETAVALYLKEIRGVSMKQLGDITFWVSGIDCCPCAKAEVVNGRNEDGSAGSGESRVSEVAHEGAGSGV